MNHLKAALIAVALASIAGLLPGPAPAQVPEETLVSPILGGYQLQRIALVPLVIHSSENPTYLREGLRDMLVSRLEQGGRLEVTLVGRDRATTNVESALETGREVGADFVLFGSFTRFGQGASLDMQCAATQGAEGRPPLRQIFVHAGDIASMIPDLDELVGKVGRFVDEFGGAAVAARGEGGSPAAVLYGGSNGSPAPLGAAEVSSGELLERIKALEEAVRALSEEKTLSAEN